MTYSFPLGRDHIVKTTCRYCQSKKLIQFLSLGNHPPSNSFILPSQIPSEKRYPLEVYICENCFLVQLIDVVNPKIIFDDYLYLSSSSKALMKHFSDLAKTLTSRFKLKSGDVVIDIGCNDGILLNGYTLPGLIRVGVEPSKVAKIARDSGLEVLKEFFGVRSAQKIIKKYGQAKIITATNVFAHVDDIAEFTASVVPLLHNKGVFIIEAAYLIDLIDQTLFDTIYHEHLCYLSVTPMVPFFTKFGLEVFDAERVPFGASGPAIRVFVAKKGAKTIRKSVKKILVDEWSWGIKKMDRYLQYAQKVEKIKKQVLKKINNLRKNGIRIGGYGAPAKGNTLLNYFELTSQDIKYIAETNPLKQGHITPGSHIPIISEEEFVKRMPECALLLTWNYLDFFLKNSSYIKKGGKFLVPLPKPKIVP